MLSFKLNLKGLEKGKELTKDKAKRVLMKSMFKMEELAIKNAPVDRGQLRERINLFPQILSDKYVLKSEAPYSADLEYGNSPRQVKWEDIEKWVKRKGIANTEDKVFLFTRYTVEKIRKEGVNPQPFMRPALNHVQNFWIGVFKKEELK